MKNKITLQLFLLLSLVFTSISYVHASEVLGDLSSVSTTGNNLSGSLAGTVDTQNLGSGGTLGSGIATGNVTGSKSTNSTGNTNSESIVSYNVASGSNTIQENISSDGMALESFGNLAYNYNPTGEVLPAQEDTSEQIAIINRDDDANNQSANVLTAANGLNLSTWSWIMMFLFLLLVAIIIYVYNRTREEKKTWRV